MNKLEKTVTIITMSLMLALLGFMLIISYYPFKILEPIRLPLEVLTPTVEQGGTVEYRLHYQKYMKAQAQIDRSLICDNYDSIILSSGFSGYPKGEIKQLNFISIPINAPVGTCHISISINYRIFNVRTVNYTYSTETFLVTKLNLPTQTIIKTQPIYIPQQPIIINPITQPTETDTTNNNSSSSHNHDNEDNNSNENKSNETKAEEKGIVSNLIDKLL